MESRRTRSLVNTSARKRRQKNIPRACNVCRRRKGRCDGRKPCHYCSEKSLECQYDTNFYVPSGSGATANIHTLSDDEIWINYGQLKSLTSVAENIQLQLNELMSQISSIQNSRYALPAQSQNYQDHPLLAAEAPSLSKMFSPVNNAKMPTLHYFGPTSSEYSLERAERKLNQTQVSQASSKPEAGCESATSNGADEDHSERSPINIERKGLASENSPKPSPVIPYVKALEKGEAVRLIGVYEEVVGELYPIIDITKVTKQVEEAYSMHATLPSDRKQTVSDIAVSTIVLAISLSSEYSGRNVRGEALYTQVEDKMHGKLCSGRMDISSIVIFLLMGMYHFFCDDIRVAWRMVSIAGRAAIELGLHRQETIVQHLPSGSDRAEITRMISSIYVLDRLWSCAAGLPQSFEGAGLESYLLNLPNPPHLSAMVSYGTYFPEIKRFLKDFGTKTAYDDDQMFQSLSENIEQWRGLVLKDLKFSHPRDYEFPARETSSSILPTLLYLRANQLRGLILRPFFWESSEAVNEEKVKLGLELANDTIFVLSDVNATTDAYHHQVPTFHHFLSSSVALLLLIIAHQTHGCYPSSTIRLPVDIDATITRATDLAAFYRHFSSSSQRLWARLLPKLLTLRKLGIPRCDQPSNIGLDLSGVSHRDGHIPLSSDTAMRSTQDNLQASQQWRDGGVFPSFRADEDLRVIHNSEVVPDISDIDAPDYLLGHDFEQSDWTWATINDRSWDAINHLFPTNEP